MSNFRLGSLSDVGKFIRGITFKPTDTVEFGNRDSVVCMRTKNVQRDLDESDLMCVPSRFIKRREQIFSIHRDDWTNCECDCGSNRINIIRKNIYY